ncbi:MAG: hypothetical protein NVS3B18_07010 [Candidatus Dormibacteria bacterium]
MLALRCQTPTSRHQHQGAVCPGTLIHWLPDTLQLLRPTTSGGWTVVEMGATLSPRPFHGSPSAEPMEAILAVGKLRPVIVVSSNAEIAAAQEIRVVPIQTYNPGSILTTARVGIERGDRPQWLHLADFGSTVHEGVARCDHQRPVLAKHLPPPVASLTTTSLDILLERLSDYALLK